MKRFSTISFLIFLTGYLHAGNDPYIDSTLLFTKAQLQEDYKILVKTLHEAYPSLYRYNAKKDIDLFLVQGLSKINRSMTEREFYPLVASTTSRIKDEHLIPTPSDSYYENQYKKRTRFVPFSIKIFGSKMFVHKSATPELQTGDEIISINGKYSKNIIPKLIKYLHHDGYIQTFLYRHLEDFSPTQNENLFDLYYSIFNNLAEKVALQIKTPKGTLSKVECGSLSYPEYQDFYGKRKYYGPPLQYKLFGENIAYLSVSSFHYEFRDRYGQNFDSLFQIIFSRLDSNKTKNLIIDLRLCEGGDNSNLLLLSYLMNKPFRVIEYLEVKYSGLPSISKYFENADNAYFIDSLLYRNDSGMYRLKSKFESTVPGYADISPKSDAFKGNIFVLTSGATGSAAGVLSSILKNSKRATFIGEETGGAMEGPTALNIPILILPNTKIKVEIPLIKIQLAVKYQKGRGVIPDYPVETTLQDLINNVDTQLEFALKLARK